MMRDIASMVTEASPMISQIEEAVTAANDNIVAGGNQLTSAAGYQVNRSQSSCMTHLNILSRKNIAKKSV